MAQTNPRSPARIAEAADVGIVSALLMLGVGGFIDAYLFLRHGVFAFAQTGNVVFLAIGVVQGHAWTTYLWPLLAYAAGLAAAQALRAARPALPHGPILGIMVGQVMVFAALALLPASAPAALFVVPLSFVGGIRLDLFRSAGGLSFVSIGTTGNMMRFVQSVGAAARERTAERRREMAMTGLVVLAFAAGAFLGAAASNEFGPSALGGAVLLELAAVVTYVITRAKRGTAAERAGQTGPASLGSAPGARQ